MALAAGTRLGPYEVLSPLGAGGMGEVYRARDTRLHREVAVKVLPAAVANDPHALARFERETRALASLSHPAILALHDIGREGEVAYAVTELLSGETLRDALRPGPLPWREAVQAAAEIADGLEAAHVRGVVHRDLKPENLFRCSDGRIKILDFGLARAEVLAPEATTESEAPRATSPGALVGTVGYMAPEQLRGLGVDHRADLFAFGCVLHELLTGHRAFQGRTPSEVIAAILREEPSLEDGDPSVPGAVRQIVLRCLRKSPADRFSSARDVGLALRAILSGSASDLAADVRPRRARRAVAFVLLGLAAAACAAWILLRRDSAGLPPLLPRQLTSGAACESEPALSPDGETVAFVAEEGGRSRVLLVGTEGGTPLALTDGSARASSPTWMPDGKSLLCSFEDRGGYAVVKVGRFGGAAQRLLANARDPAVSPDGTLVAFSRPDGNGFSRIHVAPLSKLEEARVVSRAEDGAFEHRQPRFSPDGRTICYRDFHGLWLVPVAGGTARRLSPGTASDADPSFDPDGSHVYFSSYRDSTLAIWRIAIAGGAPERITLGTGMERGPCLSRDGRRLAYATYSEGGALVLVDRATGAKTRLEESRLFGMAALDPLGRFVVYSSSRENAFDLWRQPLAGGQFAGAATRLTQTRGVATCPSISPDGQWVAYYTVRDENRDIQVVSSLGGEPQPVAPSPAADFLPSWSPDGTKLLFVSDRDGREGVWIVPMKDGRPAGEPRRAADAVPPAASFPRFLPDGRSLVVTVGETERGDVWVVPPDGAAARRLTHGGTTWWAVPDPATDDYLVLDRSSAGRRTIRALPRGGGEFRAVAWGEPDRPATDIVDFDVSTDGRLAVLIEEIRRGDIWLLETSTGRRF